MQHVKRIKNILVTSYKTIKYNNTYFLPNLLSIMSNLQIIKPLNLKTVPLKYVIILKQFF